MNKWKVVVFAICFGVYGYGAAAAPAQVAEFDKKATSMKDVLEEIKVDASQMRNVAGGLQAVAVEGSCPDKDMSTAQKYIPGGDPITLEFKLGGIYESGDFSSFVSITENGLPTKIDGVRLENSPVTYEVRQFLASKGDDIRLHWDLRGPSGNIDGTTVFVRQGKKTLYCYTAKADTSLRFAWDPGVVLLYSSGK